MLKYDLAIAATLKKKISILGILFFQSIRRDPLFTGFERFVIIVFILCNGISIGLNLSSYLSLAKEISYAAIFGLSQVISLTIGLGCSISFTVSNLLLSESSPESVVSIKFCF